MNCMPRSTRSGSSEKAAGKVAKAARPQIGHAVEGVNAITGERVAADGIYSEIATGSGLALRHGGIALYFKVGVSGTDA